MKEWSIELLRASLLVTKNSAKRKSLKIVLDQIRTEQIKLLNTHELHTLKKKTLTGAHKVQI